MNNWISPTVKQIRNFTLHVLHNLFGCNITTTAFCLGRSCLHLVLLRSCMAKRILPCCSYLNKTHIQSQSAECKRVLLCVGRQSGERSGQCSALGLGHRGAVAVVDVENGHVATAHLLNFGAVPLVVDELGCAQVTWNTTIQYNVYIDI